MIRIRTLIGALLVACVLGGIAALSPVTSKKYWETFEEVSGISNAAFLPMGDLPFRVIRGPALHSPKARMQFSSVKRIDLDRFFGFELKTMPDKDRFQLNLDDKEYTVRLKSLEVKGDEYFTWIGTLDDNENHLLVLTFLNGYAGANINGPSGVYAIHYEHGRHLLKKFDGAHSR